MRNKGNSKFYDNFECEYSFVNVFEIWTVDILNTDPIDLVRQFITYCGINTIPVSCIMLVWEIVLKGSAWFIANYQCFVLIMILNYLFF